MSNTLSGLLFCLIALQLSFAISRKNFCAIFKVSVILRTFNELYLSISLDEKKKKINTIKNFAYGYILFYVQDKKSRVILTVNATNNDLTNE